MSTSTHKRICSICRQEITVVAAHAKCIFAMFVFATERGTYSDDKTNSQFCGVCRHWCDAIYYIGFDGTRMCAAGADNCGQGPKADELARIKQQQKYAPAAQGDAVRAGKDAAHGSAAARDGRFLNQPRRQALPPLSDEERRRRFPMAEPLPDLELEVA